MEPLLALPALGSLYHRAPPILSSPPLSFSTRTEKARLCSPEWGVCYYMPSHTDDKKLRQNLKQRGELGAKGAAWDGFFYWMLGTRRGLGWLRGAFLFGVTTSRAICFCIRLCLHSDAPVLRDWASFPPLLFGK
jgi:hypothetical protein